MSFGDSGRLILTILGFSDGRGLVLAGFGFGDGRGLALSGLRLGLGDGGCLVVGDPGSTSASCCSVDSESEGMGTHVTVSLPAVGHSLFAVSVLVMVSFPVGHSFSAHSSFFVTVVVTGGLSSFVGHSFVSFEVTYSVFVGHCVGSGLSTTAVSFVSAGKALTPTAMMQRPVMMLEKRMADGGLKDLGFGMNDGGFSRTS